MLPYWRGQTVVILGGGASLSGTALRRIARARLAQQCKVIAVNDAVYLAWWADWLHACDAKWWQANGHYVRRFEGIRTTADETTPHGCRASFLTRTGNRGFDRRRSKVRGNNSGYQALHGAIAAAAARIVLVGFDMQGGHWFEGPADTHEADYGAMVGHFKSLRRVLKNRGIEVVNCSPGSALKCFPFETLERALAPIGSLTGESSLAPLSLPALH